MKILIFLILANLVKINYCQIAAEDLEPEKSAEKNSIIWNTCTDGNTYNSIDN